MFLCRAQARWNEESTVPNISSIPRDDAGKLALLQHLNAKLPFYAPILEVSAEELAQLRACTEWFELIISAQDSAYKYTDALFACKRVLREGPKSTTITLPPPPVIPPLPVSEPCADIFGFLSDLITRVKQHKNYIEAIGQVLGINALPPVDLAYSTLRPVLTVNFQGGHPLLSWKSNRADALELEADHGTGQFRLLTIKMLPGYLDKNPLPPLGSIALWKYRAIYRIRDEQVGQWSEVLDVGVRG